MNPCLSTMTDDDKRNAIWYNVFLETDKYIEFPSTYLRPMFCVDHGRHDNNILAMLRANPVAYDGDTAAAVSDVTEGTGNNNNDEGEDEDDDEEKDDTENTAATGSAAAAVSNSCDIDDADDDLSDKFGSYLGPEHADSSDDDDDDSDADAERAKISDQKRRKKKQKRNKEDGVTGGGDVGDDGTTTGTSVVGGDGGDTYVDINVDDTAAAAAAAVAAAGEFGDHGIDDVEVAANNGLVNNEDAVENDECARGLLENDEQLIQEQSPYGKIPEIPDEESTDWDPKHRQQLIERNKEWRDNRNEHLREGPCNQLFHERGLQHWNRRFQTIPHLLECVASRGDYEKMKKTIVNLKSFGKDWKVYPLLHPKENLIHFCRFRCVLNPYKCKLIEYVNDSERNKRVSIYDYYEPRYFEAVAKLNDNSYVFTIREKHLRLIDGVDVDELIYVHANDFTDIRLGEKGDQPNDQFDINSESTILNVFSHKHNNYKSLCVLGTFCAAISALGFPDKAMEMFHAHKDTLHQGTINLWYLVEKEYHNYIKTAELRSISTPGGINARQLLNMYDGWPIILSIMSTKGKRSHFICICNGLIYDTNSDTVLLKTNENLDKCAQLHQFGSDDTFHKSHRVYRFLAINLGVTGKPLWNMVLPKREGWDFQDKRLCFLCNDKKYAEEYSLSQWKKAFLKKGKCKQCSAA